MTHLVRVVLSERIDIYSKGGVLLRFEVNSLLRLDSVFVKNQRPHRESSERDSFYRSLACGHCRHQGLGAPLVGGRARCCVPHPLSFALSLSLSHGCDFYLSTYLFFPLCRFDGPGSIDRKHSAVCSFRAVFAV